MNKSIKELIIHTINTVFDEYFKYVNFDKFKDHIDPRKIYHMLLWIGDGYLMDRQRCGEGFDVDQMLKDFNEWKVMFKEMCYKEEYL